MKSAFISIKIECELRATPSFSKLRPMGRAPRTQYILHLRSHKYNVEPIILRD